MTFHSFFFILLIIPTLLIVNPLFAANTNTRIIFAPKGGSLQAEVEEINKAKKTINIAMYNLTSIEIARALIAAKDRGVTIRVFVDKVDENTKHSQSRYLVDSGIEVKCYTGSRLMHNKFAVIDSRVLITGWTSTENTIHQENLLITTDRDKELIKQYSDRFEYLWTQGNIKVLESSRVRISGDGAVISVNREGF